MTTTTHVRALEDHYASTWGPPASRASWARGPIHQLPAEFRVLFFRRPGDASVYATCGMSDADDVEALELHLFAPHSEEPYDDVVELLTVVAHYHRTGERLGLAHSVDFGRPWLPSSSCTHGVVSLPYLDGATLERMESSTVRCLWLIPVTPGEIAFKKAYGMDALEERFEQSGLGYADPLRMSVV